MRNRSDSFRRFVRAASDLAAACRRRVRGWRSAPHPPSNPAAKTMITVLLAVAVFSGMLQIRETAEDVSEFLVHEMVRNEAFAEALAAIPTVSDLNERDSDGHTLLTLAFQKPRRECFEFVEALLRHGADKSAPDAHGLQPIHYASRNGDLAAVMLLVNDYGADVNAKPARGSEAERTSPGVTPLAMAYRVGLSPGVVEFLKRYNARAPKGLEEHYKFLAEVHENMRRIGEMEDDPAYSGDRDQPFIEALKMTLPSSSHDQLDALGKDIAALNERVSLESERTGEDYLTLYRVAMRNFMASQPPERLAAIEAAVKGR